MKNLRWADGLMQLEVGMCAQSEVLSSFMNDKFLQNHVNIPTRQNNILDLILSVTHLDKKPDSGPLAET